ncbi:MAG: DUF4143 domain-containing protein, partial [archaeon]|nr:DUF4143 domain-containing protein [archaeon]
LVEEFAKTTYRQYIRLDLENNPGERGIFKGNLDVDSIVERIALYTGESVLKGECLLFFDGIEHCAEAYSSLKWFTQDGRYDVIATMTFPEFLMQTSDSALSPVGYVEDIRLDPMDFEEFLWAMGVPQDITDMVRRHVLDGVPLDDYYLDRIDGLYRRYIIVGGMPEAVNEYVSSRDYPKVRAIQRSILERIRDDVDRHSTKPESRKIVQCLESIPFQLFKSNNIFRYNEVCRKNASGRKYDFALLWLENAGISLRSRNLSEPRSPLAMNERNDSFKMFMADTGLLVSMVDPSYAYEIVVNDPYVNNGAFLESAVACALHSAGFPLRFFRNKDSTMELDFVISKNNGLNVIEVESGRKKRSSSLLKAMSTYSGTHALKISGGNIFVDGNGVLHLPLFALWFYENTVPTIPEPDLSYFMGDTPYKG